MPPVFALLDALLGDWEAAAAGEGPAVANGQFILLRRDGLGGARRLRADPRRGDRRRGPRRAGCAQRGFRTGFFRERRAAGAHVPRARRGAARLAAQPGRALRRAAGRWRRRSSALLLLPPPASLAALAAGRWVEAALLWTAGAAASVLLRAGSGHAAALGPPLARRRPAPRRPSLALGVGDSTGGGRLVELEGAGDAVVTSGAS